MKKPFFSDMIARCFFFVGGIATRFVLFAIHIYRIFFSPLKRFFIPTGHCRYSPSCSNYALEAFTRFGFKQGVILTTKRLLRCHPWGSYGYDPVPQKLTKKES